RYKAIVKYKTAFYSFYLPVAAAMYMAGIDGEEEHRVAQSILLEMGEFFQIQDDFLDCFGDPEVTGKVGTEISRTNKCSWLVVQALTRASPAQRRLLEEDYGRREAESVARVKALYGELGLRQAFHQYEEQSYQRLCSMVTQQGSRLPPQVFLAFADRIYKRKK
ncbi:LOW QUALITY PROTEIN: farnesyl pyrophosphate synthase, partial [Leucoraja erinacea]|uniref:LOW QUALITY PROTEIN: farnesyl pyrophosphate synthase n=1 Tax=Leucoraja erinaceus TaxID=7782 RepID=UPI002458E697